MFIFAFLLTFLILSRGKIRWSNDILLNDGNQFPAMSQETYHLSNYDITFWIRRLQVEHYAFFENGDYFYTIFVELDDSPFIMKIINSYYAIKLFFQLCNGSIFNIGNLCSLKLTEFRKFNYMLAEAPRVFDINKSYLSIDDYIQKNISMCALGKGLNNNSRKSNQVSYNNDFKEILLVIPKYMKSMRSLGRHLLQSVDHDKYGYENMDYNAGGKFAYEEYRRYKDSIMSENKDEIENAGDNDDDDDESDDDNVDEEENYEISDEPAENENVENLEEEDNELEHQSIGPKARIASFNRIIFPYTSKKQKQHSRKENIRIRSVTEECDEEELTEEPQYYDYEANGHDASLGIIHKTKIEHFIRLIIILILIICWI